MHHTEQIKKLLTTLVLIHTSSIRVYILMYVCPTCLSICQAALQNSNKKCYNVQQTACECASLSLKGQRDAFVFKVVK